MESENTNKYCEIKKNKKAKKKEAKKKRIQAKKAFAKIKRQQNNIKPKGNEEEESKEKENSGNDNKIIPQNFFKLSLEKFIEDKLVPKIEFVGKKISREFTEEPEWNPLLELALEMSEIPQPVLKEWLTEHAEHFASDFDNQNCNCESPFLFNEPLDLLRTNNAEF